MRVVRRSRFAASPAGIPADVHYRPSKDPAVACDTCSFYSSGTCQMFDAAVSPSYVCDRWEAVKADLAIGPVPASHHTRVLKAAAARVDALEEELASLLIPVLLEAGRVAAANFEARATRRMTARALTQTFSAPGVTRMSTMVAVKPRPEEAAALAGDGQDPAELHVTLAYLGETEGSLGDVVDALAAVPGSHAPIEGQVGGVGCFGDNGRGHPSILLPSAPGLLELRHHVTEALADKGIEYGREHGFQPHITVGYGPPVTAAGDETVPGAAPIPSVGLIGSPLHFDDLWVVRGDVETTRLPLTGGKPVTAAGDPDEIVEVSPGWGVRRGDLDLIVTLATRGDHAGVEEQVAAVAEAHAPEGGYGDTWFSPSTGRVFWCSADWSTDEEVQAAEDAFLEVPGVEGVSYDAEVGEPDGGDGADDWVKVWPAGDALTAAADNDFCLPASVRGITDPVRQAAVEAVMRSSLEDVGMAFDPTNPLAAQVLSQAASQVQGIAQTTQLDVMKTIRASYEQGLSIPDTAKSIQAVMSDAAPARARTIARTELSGAVHGGSLAATQIVAKVSGDTYDKTWRTAPGAQYPRHEDYDGLDGQTVGLDDDFDVGDSELSYPGDPAGDAGETINCRCSMTYGPEGDGEGDDDAVEASGAPRTPCGAHRGPSLMEEMAEVLEALAGPSDAGWSSPAPSEVLNVSCEGLPTPPVAAPPASLSRDAVEPVPLAAPTEQEQIASTAQGMAARATGAEPVTTAALRGAAQANGGTLVGLKNAVKTEASLERKITGDLEQARLRDPGATVEQVSDSINDSLRYTMQFSSADYTAGVEDTIDRLEEQGFKPVRIKNFWESGDDYNGINAVFTAPDGTTFELQFHTPESFATKSGPLHALYEEYRVATDPDEKARLWAEMKVLTDETPTPAGVLGVGTLVKHTPPA